MGTANQTGSAPIQAGAGRANLTPTTPETGLQQFLSRIQRQNQDFNELVLLQRDHAVRITGINPVDEPTPSDAPEATGIMAEISTALAFNNELVEKLRSLTNHWTTV